MSLNRSDSGIFSKISSVVVAVQPRGVGVNRHVLSFESAAYVFKATQSQTFCCVTSHTLNGLTEQICDGMLIVLQCCCVCDQQGLNHSRFMCHWFSGDTRPPMGLVRYGVIHVALCKHSHRKIIYTDLGTIKIYYLVFDAVLGD
jgi:hypothetical protein